MWRRVDDVLRFVYVLLTPVMIVSLGKVVPIGGILISTGIATVIALTGSTAWITTVRTIPVLGRPLASFARLGEYYRVHPPKPLIHYVLYPLLIPYWLAKASARREFLAYKRIGAVALIVTTLSAVYDYFHNWDPLPRHYFFGALAATTVLQLLITFAFVMPIVTTLVGYHKRGHRKSIAVLVVVALGLGVTMAYTMRRLEMVSFATRSRVRARIKWQPEQARAVMQHALQVAAPKSSVHEAQDAARAELETMFRPDEARAFYVVAGEGVVILLAKTKSHEYAWAAVTKHGPITSAAELPADGRALLELAPTASAWP